MKQILFLLLLSLPKHLVGGDYSETFLPAMFPPLSKHHKYCSAKCLSHTSELTRQRHYFLMAAVEMTEWHVGTGFLHVNGKNEHGYQSCQPLHELDSAWGLFTYKFFQASSEENSPKEVLLQPAGILHTWYVLGPAGLPGPELSGLSQQFGTPECLRPGVCFSTWKDNITPCMSGS